MGGVLQKRTVGIITIKAADHSRRDRSACNVTHSYMWHHSLIYVISLIQIYDVTHSRMQDSSLVWLTWRIHKGGPVTLQCVAVSFSEGLSKAGIRLGCCNVLQFVAVCCSVLQFVIYIHLYIHSVTHCNTLQHTATYCITLQHTVTHCNTLQHTATHCNTLQHTATHCIYKWNESKATVMLTATHCSTLQHTTTPCNALQHPATHCNTLQHAATNCIYKWNESKTTDGDCCCMITRHFLSPPTSLHVIVRVID